MAIIIIPAMMPPTLIIPKIAFTIANTIPKITCDAAYIPVVIHARASHSSVLSQIIPAIMPTAIRITNTT